MLKKLFKMFCHDDTSNMVVLSDEQVKELENFQRRKRLCSRYNSSEKKLILEAVMEFLVALPSDTSTAKETIKELTDKVTQMWVAADND